MKTELATIVPSEFGLDELQAQQITSGMDQILSEREELSKMYSKVIMLPIEEENIPKFKELRLKIRDNRTKGIEAWHKTNKEFYLRGGQFVDAIKRKEVEVNARMEANLQENETYFERIEAERIAKLQNERANALLKLEVENIPTDLGSMQDDVYEAYESLAKEKFKAKKAAEKKAEEEQIAAEKAEQEERIRIAKENEALRKQYEEDQKARKLELEQAAAERKKAEEKAAKEKAKLEAEIKAEKEKKAKLEAELKAKKQAEEEEIREAEERNQLELSKGDSEKVQDLIADLTKLKSKYEFKSAKNIKMYSDVSTLLDKVINYINQ